MKGAGTRRRGELPLALLCCACAGALSLAAADADLQRRIELLIEQMGRGHYAGKAAHDRLVRIGRPAVPALIRAADDAKPLRRWWAISALCTIGDTRAIAVLLRRIHDRHPVVRHVAIYHAKSFVKRDGRVAEAVMDALDSPDTGDVLWAVRGLGSVGYRRAAPALRRVASGHRAPEVRFFALWALTRIEGRGAVDLLLERLRNDEAAVVRRQAADCLRKVGPPLRRVVGALVGALRDPAPEVRLSAWRALRKLTGQTFGLTEPPRDVPRTVALRAVRWWLKAREKFPTEKPTVKTTSQPTPKHPKE